MKDTKEYNERLDALAKQREALVDQRTTAIKNIADVDAMIENEAHRASISLGKVAMTKVLGDLFGPKR